MKCIKCNKDAIYVIHGNSLCEECYIEYNKSIKPMRQYK